jgi:hypothetical protein
MSKQFSIAGLLERSDGTRWRGRFEQKPADEEKEVRVHPESAPKFRIAHPDVRGYTPVVPQNSIKEVSWARSILAV